MKIYSSGPAGKLGAAIIPAPAGDARAYQSWGRVSGSPGTVRIGAPSPAGVPEMYPFQALHKSADAPDAWRPGVYYQPAPAAPPDVSVYSDNQMPVPAATPTGTPAIMLRHPTFLGQRQVPAINQTPWFPPWLKGTG